MAKLGDSDWARFWAQVDYGGTGCWDWKGSRTAEVKPGRGGYGQFSATGGFRRNASWFAYWMFHDIPVNGSGNLVVMHLCDRPICVRPSHLKLGTQSENIKHAWDSGRQPRKQQRRAVMRKARDYLGIC